MLPRMKWRKRALILAGGVLQYVASVGPVAGYFLRNNPHPNPVIEVAAVVVYSPLTLITYLCPPLRQALESYCDYFCPRSDDADPGP